MPTRLNYLVQKKTKNHPPPNYPYYVSVLAIFKNETLNLKVWVDHYLWMGVDHLFLIDNGSDDNPRKILEPYIKKGLVSVYDMPEKWKQPEHYRHIYQNHIKHKSKWVIIADADEFWYVKNSTIRKTLPQYEDYHVLLSQWRWFGSDGHVQHPNDVRTSIVHRRKNFQKDTKYIFQSYHVNVAHVWIHHTVGGSYKQLNVNDIFRLNHYPIQSEEYFEKVKMTRGSANCAKHEHVKTKEYFERANQDTTFVDTDLKQMIEHNMK